MAIQQNPLVRHIALPILRRILPRNKPAAIVIGGGKGGTTSLYHYLAYHPQVVASKGKELNFFNADQNYGKGTSSYHSNFRLKLPFSKTVSFDVSPDYLAESYFVASRIYEYDPDIKLIALLRNPIDATFSRWKMQQRYWNSSDKFWVDHRARMNSPEELEEKIPRPENLGQIFLADIQLDIELWKDRKWPQYAVLNSSRHFTLIKEYYDRFPRENIRVFKSEDFSRIPFRY